MEAEIAKNLLVRFALGRGSLADIDCYFHGYEPRLDPEWRADFFARLTCVTDQFLAHPDVLERLAGIGPRLGNVLEWEVIVRAANAGAPAESLGRSFWRLSPIFANPPHLPGVGNSPVGQPPSDEFVSRMTAAAQVREAEEAGEAQDLVLELNQLLAGGDLDGALELTAGLMGRSNGRPRRVVQRSLQRVYAIAIDEQTESTLAKCLDIMAKYGVCNEKDVAAALRLFRHLGTELAPDRITYWLQSPRVEIDSHLAVAVALLLGQGHYTPELAGFVREHWHDDFGDQSIRFGSCALSCLADCGAWSDVLELLPTALGEGRIDTTALRHVVRTAYAHASEGDDPADIVEALKQTVMKIDSSPASQFALLMQLDLSPDEERQFMTRVVANSDDNEFVGSEFVGLFPVLMERIQRPSNADLLLARVQGLPSAGTIRASWLREQLRRGQQPNTDDVDATLDVLTSATPYVQGLVLTAIVESRYRSDRLEAAYRAYAALPEGRVTGVVITLLDYLVSRPTWDSLALVRFTADQLVGAEAKAVAYNVLVKRAAQIGALDLQDAALSEMRTANLPISRYTLGPTIALRERAGLVYRDDQEVVRPDAHEWTDLQVLLDDVIHELNQPLATAGLSLDTLRRAIALHNEGAAQASATALEGAIRKLGERIAVYRSMSVGADVAAEVDVAELLMQLREVVHGPASEAGVRLDFVVESENPWHLPMQVWGNAFQLRLALRGLLMNSIQAMAIANTPNPALQVQALISPGPAEVDPVVDVWVRDNGPGIPEDIRERIFDRGFTTKKGRGLGLGLSLASAVVRGHGGQISLTSTPAEGAEFFIRLPLAATNRSSS